ncbi:sensor histidine kinase [Pontibacter beigongshangensis]|uniref:sensor histidine kinase n=1 Tax=Pontibacter beigongshangensis TaxID=2574733 RepID=UPI0016500D85|nr:PAS domain-containing sensor histidine kinase [Pontibacter beigongshangensis]
MTDILHIGLYQETLNLLQENWQQPDPKFRKVEGKDLKQVNPDLRAAYVLLIGEEVENPIRVAQEAYALDKYISVLLINDVENHTKIKHALQFSPFIGPTVQSFSNRVGKQLVSIVEDAVQRTRQRRSYARVKAAPLPITNLSSGALEKVRVDYTAKVLEEAPIGAALISRTGHLLTINSYAANLFLKSEKEILGTSFADLFPEPMQEEVRQYMLDGYLTEPKKVFELQDLEKCRYLEMAVADINAQDASQYKIIILNNITSTVLAQKHTQAHLEQLEKLNANLKRVNDDLDTFVYTASHDLKSPILNIEGLVNLLEEGLGAAKASVAKELEHIKTSVQRFKLTVEDLTEVARIQRSFDQAAEPLDVAQLVEEVKQLIGQEMVESGAQINLNSVQAPFLHFSKRNFKSILYNLLHNAIKYRSPSRQPVILITTWRDGSDFVITVQDNGLGIPGQKRERVFELFKRMHSHVQGSGVGLYIVKRIIDNVGGSISIESEEQQGTTFVVRFKEMV